MRFGVLGPLTVHDGGVPITPAAPMSRRLLAALLCRPGHRVPATELAEILWESSPPRSARKTLQVYVHRLRGVLGGDRVRLDHGGYWLAVEPAELDAVRFAELVEGGRTARRRGEPHEASAMFASALALWRGAAYAGTRVGTLINDRARRLEEQRLLTIEERAEVELDLGRHAELVAELASLADAHPYRERLRALLMLALYRANRQADALEIFRQTRALLAGELGVEPGVLMRRLHEAMLHDDDRLTLVAVGSLDRTWQPISPPGAAPAPAAQVPPARSAQVPVAQASAVRVPRELPCDVAAFTGRDIELTALDSLLPPLAKPPGTSLTVVAITGTAGVGKTALAVHWAHRVAERFPDGQLHVQLCGFARRPPLRPIEALRALLHGLGVPADRIPDDVDMAAPMYRTLLAGRRVLVVLDNAAGADQVRPLLPAGGGSFVLVTSRDAVGGLVAVDGARRLSLDVLPHDQAFALLTRLLEADRAAAEPAAIAELAATCGYLPLALRISAARLTAQPRRRIGSYVARMRDRARLPMLSIPGDEHASVAAAIHLSYARLPRRARRLFRLLALAPGHDVTVGAAAALADVTPEQADGLLDVLAGLHLVDEHEPGRYTCHVLLREYAAHRAGCEDAESYRHAALDRLYAHSLHASTPSNTPSSLIAPML